MIPLAGQFAARRVIRGMVIIGLGLTAALIVYLLSQREQEREAGTAGGDGRRDLAPRPRSDIAARPQQGIVLPKPEETRAVAAQLLPLVLKANPASFKRDQEGAIIATTLPGAECHIHVVYSTGRGPSSLEAESRLADAKGVVRWTWQIGTSGTHADVRVSANLAGHDEAVATLRVRIVT